MYFIYYIFNIVNKKHNKHHFKPGNFNPNYSFNSRIIYNPYINLNLTLLT